MRGGSGHDPRSRGQLGACARNRSIRRVNRPLLITACDEVLLHFVTPFHGWAGEAHDIDFELERHDFFNSLRYRACGSPVEREKGWAIFNQFFTDEMHRQPLVPDAAETLTAIAAHADVVVRSEEHTSELQSLMRISYAVFCLKTKK